jgi:SAM-dependent methyltransferase
MAERITFSFGENWLNYVKTFDEEKFREAKRSLADLLDTDNLAGKTFLDIGSGSGVFSLAAVDMGAQAVISIDVDPKSVQACREIKGRADVSHWTILEGSILDLNLIERLPKADIVYSWGVLHHTGAMWQAIDNAATLVNDGGLFVIAIYNHHWSSSFWLRFKQVYNRSGDFFKKLMVWFLLVPRVLVRVLKGKPPLKDKRGMSVYYDAIDWAGGFPYEYASFDEVVSFCQGRGFVLRDSIRTNSIGCNQFVFERR